MLVITEYFIPVQLVSSDPSLHWGVPSHTDELVTQKALARSGSMQRLSFSAQITENKSIIRAVVTQMEMQVELISPTYVLLTDSHSSSRIATLAV